MAKISYFGTLFNVRFIRYCGISGSVYTWFTVVYILLYITNALWEIFYQYFYFLFYRDGFIDGEELNNLLSAVFSDGTESYSFNTDYKSELMQLLDQDKV